MTNDLAGLLAELRTDHKNMSLLLDVLELESDRLYDGGEADYELMHDVMRYMTIYPDAVHHPKEDRVYAELATVRPDLANGVEKIGTDHRDLAALGAKLRNDIESIMSGTALRRNVIVADAMRYIKRLRDHMRWEERDLFIRIEEMRRDGHTTITDPEHGDKTDPVFGPEVQKDFDKLYASVQQALDANSM